MKNKECKVCSAITYHGWVENPIYGKERNQEGMIEMYVHVCPRCDTIENEIIKIDIYPNIHDCCGEQYCECE